MNQLANIPTLFTASRKALKAIHLPGMKLTPATRYGEGHVYVSNGESYEANVFYGRVTAEGQWIPAFKGHTREEGELVLDYLVDLNEGGAQYLASVGRESGRCCYCGKVLTEEVSVVLGYGPTCAKYHALPHNRAIAAQRLAAA